jgi:hypothetical protein
VGTLKLETPVAQLDLSLTETNAVRCPDIALAEKMFTYIDEIRKAGDSVGGIISAYITGCPVGLGEPVFDKLHAELGKAMLSINAVKGFEYGSGLKFILINSFGYIIIFIIPFCSKLFSKNIFRLLILISIFLLLSGKMFIGGKFIINIFITLIWYFIFYKKQLILAFIFIFLLTILFFYWFPITEFLMTYFADNLLVQNKLSQVISVVNILDFDLIASSPTSIGNIIAEGRSIAIYFTNNIFISFSGLGFGGGIPDHYGYLSPLALPGMGYNEIDASRDLFFRLHLPIYEILIKSGILGFLFYTYFTIKNFMKHNIFSFFFALVFLTIFSNNKEMILLSLFFIRTSNYNLNEKILK